MDDNLNYNKWLDTLSYDELVRENSRLHEMYYRALSLYQNNRNYENAKQWRITLTKIIKADTRLGTLKKIEYTPENVYKMALQKGIKPTARFFNVYPSQIRYYVKKYENENLE